LRLQVFLGNLLEHLVRTKFLEDLTSQSLCYAIHMEALNVANINYTPDYVKLRWLLRSHKTPVSHRRTINSGLRTENVKRFDREATSSMKYPRCAISVSRYI